MEEAPHGRSHQNGKGDGVDEDDGGGYRLEEVCFYLLSRGIPDSVIYGWHEGWDIHRLVRLFWFLRREDALQAQAQTNAVAVGASTVASKGKAFREFNRETKKMIRMYEKEMGKTAHVSSDDQAKKDAEQLSKMFGGSRVRRVKGPFSG